MPMATSMPCVAPVLDSRQQHRLEQLIERWIMDPSSFIGPDGDVSTLYMRHPQGY